MAKKILLNDPILNEVAFDYLYTLSEGQRSKLNAKELRALKSAKQARQYVEKITFDEKAMMLAKLGCGFSLVLHNGNPLATKEIKALYAKYKEMTKLEVIADMAAQKIVVLTDRVLINFLNVLAESSHSDNYLLNLDFHKVGAFINKWKAENKPDVVNMAETLEYAKVINRLSMAVSLELKTIQGAFGMADLDINILMFLYDQRTRYVPRTAIDDYFAGLYKKTIIAAAVKRLVEKVLIDRNPTKNNLEYQITALGNTIVMDFHKKNISII